MNTLFLTVLAPLAGFLVLACLRDGKLGQRQAATIGSGAMLISALSALYVAFRYQGTPVTLDAWQWFTVGKLAPGIAFHYDGLALTMVGVVTGVGFLIHLFASWYMDGEADYARFFSYMNLFVAFMLILVLADNYLLLYLGWEGVGLCSYLLIGFYFRDPANGRAAIKAFTVTRVGDVFLAIGLFLVYRELGTLNIEEINRQAGTTFIYASLPIQSIALMFAFGAFGKSAQLPLHTWLADAMAGPTPVSALIHAATMVTAGVYLIARAHPLFELAPAVLSFVAVVGALTLLVAGLTALRQYDIKRVLAYSTMSQLGYMFVALGVGAWQASIVHLMVHAFFKALLFLSAGAVIIATHHEQDIRRMGGLYRKIPLVYGCFAIGAAALVALPWVSAGFYSKDEILRALWESGNTGLFLAGLVGAVITSIYTFRVFWLTFHGKARGKCDAIHGWNYGLPLVVLAVFATFVGGQIHPPLDGVLPAFSQPFGEEMEDTRGAIELLTILAALSGLAAAAWWFVGKNRLAGADGRSRSPAEKALASGFGFDALYDRIVVRPYLWCLKVLRNDPVDRAWYVLVSLSEHAFSVNSRWQSGRVRDYAVSFAGGLLVVLLIVIFVRTTGEIK